MVPTARDVYCVPSYGDMEYKQQLNPSASRQPGTLGACSLALVCAPLLMAAAAVAAVARFLEVTVHHDQRFVVQEMRARLARLPSHVFVSGSGGGDPERNARTTARTRRELRWAALVRNRSVPRGRLLSVCGKVGGNLGWMGLRIVSSVPRRRTCHHIPDAERTAATYRQVSVHPSSSS